MTEEIPFYEGPINPRRVPVTLGGVVVGYADVDENGQAEIYIEDDEAASMIGRGTMNSLSLDVTAGQMYLFSSEEQECT